MRQLANALERAVILHPGERLGRAEIEALVTAVAGEGARGDDDLAAERDRLRAALAASGGDKRAAAKALGLTYRALLARVRAHDLEGFPTYRD